METTLDVESAPSIAPGAKIVLAETPVGEGEGVNGFPQIMKAEESLINPGVPDAASGDTGAINYTLAGPLYGYRVNSWPSSDPLVTSVGGSHLSLNGAGDRTRPDSVWNDGTSAGGGGESAVFPGPSYQDGVRQVVGGHRGTPDIAMSAADSAGYWVYMSFAGIDGPGTDNPGWLIFGGTSEATPLFAVIVALADQVAGHRLGLLNPALYALGQASEHGVNTGLVDITTGNTSFARVTGYHASPGSDLASGWGTINAPGLSRRWPSPRHITADGTSRGTWDRDHGGRQGTVERQAG